MDPEQAEAAPATPAAAADPKLKGVKGWSTKTLTRTLRLLNACNACGVVVAGVITGLLAFVDSDATFSEITTILGVMLCCAESRIPNVEPRLRRSFGFLYSFVGKAIFVFFVGTMCLALDQVAGYIVGIFTIANALFNGYVMKSHPAFSSGELKRIGDPTETFESGVETFNVVVEANPKLAAQANAAVVKGATAVARAAAKEQVGGGVVATKNPFLE